ncbi:MAG: vitamin K epoxide reductase family protein [Candidatus Liptonbacteria bacterium]|nr:vitamin K epoxide reductase family protein [Candidatus Liptonbacteria bacterium]
MIISTEAQNVGFWNSALFKRAAWIFIFLSFVGLADSIYLTIEHYNGSAVNCFIVEGCDKVLSSEYAVMFGIPLGIIGAVYYLSIFSLSVFFLSGHSEKFFKAALIFSPVGSFASAYFVYLQIFVIKYICFYCMISAFSSTFLFLTATFLFFRSKKTG